MTRGPTFPRLWPSLLALTLAFLPAAPAASPPEVARAPAPAWVEKLAVPAPDPEMERQNANGTLYLLIDQQRHESSQVSYGHYARKFTSAAGVQENARVAIDFAPSHQKLTLHQLLVHRDGRTLDRLPDARVRLLDREEGMDRHVYRGFVTAAVDVEDIRVGDTLEYAFSIQGENPVFDGVFSEFVDTSWASPVARFQYRLLWPKDRYLGIETVGPNPETTRSERGAEVEYRWGTEAVPAVAFDDDAPPWHSPYGWIQLSGYRDWAEVVRWALGFYSLDDPLPAETQREIERLRALPNEEDRILGALHHVQDKVRYLSVSEGVHSHRPYPIADVIARGFGDCKDKARLLSAMLRALGFTADPALVHTDFRHRIGDWLPSPLAFDHVIVALGRDGRYFWLDPTRDHQRGSLAGRYVPSYGKALIIRAGETGLTDVTPAGVGDATVNAEATFRLPAGSSAAELDVRTTFDGREADRQRYLLASNSPAQMARDYLNFTVRLYPGAEIRQPPTFRDDEARNRVTAEETYRLPEFWRPNEQNATILVGEIYPDILDDEVVLPRTQNRTAPLAVNYPKNVRECFVLHLPTGGNFLDENVEVRDPAFTFSFTTRYKSKDRRLTIVYEYQALAAEVPPERITTYLANVRRVRELLGYSITIPKNVLDGGSVAVGALDAPNWPLIVTVLLFGQCMIAAAVGAYFWRPAWPPRPAHPRLRGLQGWLLLVALGLIARPIAVLVAFVGVAGLFDRRHWNTFTVPGETFYDPLWGPILVFECLTLTALLVASLLLLVLFLQRRRTFPVLFIAVFAVVALVAVLDHALVVLVAGKFPTLEMDTSPKDAIQAVIQAAIWIPYMLISERVRATFVK